MVEKMIRGSSHDQDRANHAADVLLPSIQGLGVKVQKELIETLRNQSDAVVDALVLRIEHIRNRPPSRLHDELGPLKRIH
jgi:hypothetical protein